MLAIILDLDPLLLNGQDKEVKLKSFNDTLRTLK